jgi:hypothetical protein
MRFFVLLSVVLITASNLALAKSIVCDFEEPQDPLAELFISKAHCENGFDVELSNSDRMYYSKFEINCPSVENPSGTFYGVGYAVKLLSGEVSTSAIDSNFLTGTGKAMYVGNGICFVMALTSQAGYSRGAGMAFSTLVISNSK